MATALIPHESPLAELQALSFTDAPDYRTAYAAAIAHGLSERDAMRCAYLKLLDTNESHVRSLRLANRYKTGGEEHAMIDVTRSVEFLTVMLAEQQRQIDALTLRLEAGPHE